MFEEPDVVVEEVMDSATHVRDHKSVSPDMLSKIWRIYRDTSERTLEITSQRVSRSDIPSLSRKYPTNNRMLRHDQIDERFYTDTFFSTKKEKKSSRGNNCGQIFVTDKGHVVPMKSKGFSSPGFEALHKRNRSSRGICLGFLGRTDLLGGEKVL